MPETQKQRVRRLAAHCQKYRGSVPRIAAIQQLITTLVPLVAIIAAMFATVEHAYWATLLLALPAAGLLVRAFIIQHDCGHGSFFASRPSQRFRRPLHERTDDGALWALAARTCAASRNVRQPRPPRRRRYRHHYRQGISAALVAAEAALQTLSPPALSVRHRRAGLFRHSAAAAVASCAAAARYAGEVSSVSTSGSSRSICRWCIIFGIADVLWVGLPMLHIASAAGGWLFFIQHQFEETTWDKAEGWDFQVAALLGSSYYKLPKVLNWFTGNIGLHHIHHLNSMIPNYRLHGLSQRQPRAEVDQPADAARQHQMRAAEACGMKTNAALSGSTSCRRPTDRAYTGAPVSLRSVRI